jgi:hypothetical protein
MISDSTFDLMLKVWRAQIPDAYRAGVYHSSPFGAIVAPPPPRKMLDKFWAFYSLKENAFFIDRVEMQFNGRRVRI